MGDFCEGSVPERLRVASVQRGRQGRHDKGLDTKPPDKGTEPDAKPIRLDITLIPRVASYNQWAENHEDVVIAPSQALLIVGSRDHEWAQYGDFLAALQNTFPDEEIWTEVID
jgi:hypothetical protein